MNVHTQQGPAQQRLVGRTGTNRRVPGDARSRGAFFASDAIVVDAIARRIATAANFERSSLLVLLRMRQQRALRSRRAPSPGRRVGHGRAWQARRKGLDPARTPRTTTPPRAHALPPLAVAVAPPAGGSSSSARPAGREMSPGNSIRARGWVRTRLAHRAERGLGDSPANSPVPPMARRDSARLSSGGSDEKFHDPVPESPLGDQRTATVLPKAPQNKPPTRGCCAKRRVNGNYNCCRGSRLETSADPTTMTANGHAAPLNEWLVPVSMLVCIACCWVALRQAFADTLGDSLPLLSVITPPPQPPPPPWRWWVG